MTKYNIDRSKQKSAKFSGCIFIFILISSILYAALILYKLIVPGNIIATANNIMANEILIRIAIAYNLILSVMVIVLAVSLFTILESVNRHLALSALFLKLAEAFIIIVFTIGMFVILQLIGMKPYLTSLELEYFKAFVGLFFNKYITIFNISAVFLGLDFIIFFYLFFKSKYIPKILAGFGIVSYTLILIYSMINIFSFEFPDILTIQIICAVPSCVFEAIIGFWLIFRGIKVQDG